MRDHHPDEPALFGVDDNQAPPPSPLADQRPDARAHAAAVLARELPNRALCDTCGGLITWATTVSGKTIPVDAEPVPHGTLCLERDQATGRQVAVVVSRGQERVAADHGIALHTSHFATCPNADRHRRRHP